MSDLVMNAGRNTAKYVLIQIILDSIFCLLPVIFWAIISIIYPEFFKLSYNYANTDGFIMSYFVYFGMTLWRYIAFFEIIPRALLYYIVIRNYKYNIASALFVGVLSYIYDMTWIRLSGFSGTSETESGHWPFLFPVGDWAYLDMGLYVASMTISTLISPYVMRYISSRKWFVRKSPRRLG